jgi:hypothetical protein
LTCQSRPITPSSSSRRAVRTPADQVDGQLTAGTDTGVWVARPSTLGQAGGHRLLGDDMGAVEASPRSPHHVSVWAGDDDVQALGGSIAW